MLKKKMYWKFVNELISFCTQSYSYGEGIYDNQLVRNGVVVSEKWLKCKFIIFQNRI